MTGTVIHGTMRPEDLIPRFIETLDELIEASTFKAGADHPIRVERIGRTNSMVGPIERRMKGPGYYESEDHQWDLESLFDLLEQWAPEGHTFGAHEGDGSDFGFWPVGDD